jgi:hypothetical protein
MEEAPTIASKFNQAGREVFVPIPGLDKMAVARDDLEEYDDSNVATSTEVISADIPLGLKGGKTLIDCEKGIKAFVKDVLAKDDKNHLPNSETGIWVYYLTEGIARDFNRTWETTPVSLRDRSSRNKLAKDIQEGKRILSKKEKNQLLAETTWEYWSNDVSSGNITMEQAFANMKLAIDHAEELKEQGLYLSSNKTEGVKNFDWKAVVNETCKIADAYKIYTREKIDIVVPNLMENIYDPERTKISKKFIKELLKSNLFQTMFKSAVASGIKDYGVYEDTRLGGAENFEVNNIDDLMRFYTTRGGRELDMKEIKNAYNINSIHLVKIKKSGLMKDRYVCWDLTNKSTGERVLKLMGKDTTTINLKM